MPNTWALAVWFVALVAGLGAAIFMLLLIQIIAWVFGMEIDWEDEEPWDDNS